MALLVYLAGAVSSFGLFILCWDYSDTSSAFRYYEYGALLLTFFFLVYAIKEYTESRKETRRRNYELKVRRTSDYRASLRRLRNR